MAANTITAEVAAGDGFGPVAARVRDAVEEAGLSARDRSLVCMLAMHAIRGAVDDGVLALPGHAPEPNLLR